MSCFLIFFGCAAVSTMLELRSNEGSVKLDLGFVSFSVQFVTLSGHKGLRLVFIVVSYYLSGFLFSNTVSFDTRT